MMSKSLQFLPVSQILTMAPTISVLLLSWILAVGCSSRFETRQVENTNNSPNAGDFNVFDGWRRNPKWASNRQELANYPKGYGADAQGGKNGAIYVVTSSSDDPVNPEKGTLRHALIQREPLWIIFEKDMSFTLKNELFVNNYKTVDGRGANVEIVNGPCFRIENVSHVIIHGISLKNCIRAKPGKVRIDPGHVVNVHGSDGDGVRMVTATHVWIDHCHFSGGQDGLLDISHVSTFVTISNNYFSDHRKTMLLGHSDKFNKDKGMYVTVALNDFGPKLVERMPRARFGFFHVANNLYNQWLMYAIGGSSNPTILSEGNHFTAPNDNSSKEVTWRETKDPIIKTWSWNSRKDVFLNGAYFVPTGKFWEPSYTESQKFFVAPGNDVPRLTRDAGPLHCVADKPC